MATGVDRFCLICFVNRNKEFELSECILDTHATGENHCAAMTCPKA